jgi:hypothetical protein
MHTHTIIIRIWVTAREFRSWTARRPERRPLRALRPPREMAARNTHCRPRQSRSTPETNWLHSPARWQGYTKTPILTRVYTRGLSGPAGERAVRRGTVHFTALPKLMAFKRFKFCFHQDQNWQVQIYAGH